MMPRIRGIGFLAAPVGVLVLINLLAHFLPFERATLGGDDIQYLLIPSEKRVEYVHNHLTTALRRPLEISYTLLHWWAGENPLRWIWPTFLASSLLSVSVYFLFRQLLNHSGLALLCGAFFVLLPNKEQIYYHLADTHLAAVHALTAASTAFFLGYLKNGRSGWWVGSWVCYAITVFWYELGFLLPVVLAAAAFLLNRRRMIACLPFLIPVVLGLLWRSGALLGQSYGSPPIHWENVKSHLFGTWPGLYVGRQMGKWILYGLARFPTLEMPWLALLVAADGVGLWGFSRWIHRLDAPAISRRTLLVSAAAAVLLVIPATLGHGLLSRHTVLSSIGFSVLAVAGLCWLLDRPARPAVRVLGWTLLLGVALGINQGIAWSQVVACRMNHAVLETLREQHTALKRSDRVLIDQDSFARRIPYTWVNNPVDRLDTYWGVDGLAGENFAAWVTYASGKRMPVHVARSPVQAQGADYCFQARPSDVQSVPQEGTWILDYATVYPRGFHQGRRS